MIYTLQDTLLKEFKYNNEETINTDDLQNFIQRHKTERIPLLQENENFILQRNLPIDTEFKEQEDNKTFAGVKHKNNISNVIVNTHLSYVMGDDLQYTSDNDEKESLEKYLEIRKNNEGAEKENKIAELIGKFGLGYEILYMDSEQNIKFSTAKPQECFVIYNYDLEAKPIWGVRYYLDYNNNTNIELYGKKMYKKYVDVDGNLQLVEEKINFFNVLPMVEYRNNDNMLCDFQPVKTYLVDIDKTLTTESNLIHYINDALLIFTNVDVDEEDLAKMIKNKVLILNNGEGVESGLDFLEKPLNVEGIAQHLTTLYKNAFNQSFTPFISSEELKSAPSGKALQVMYLSADLIAKIKESKLTKGFKQRIDVIFKMLNFTRNTPLEYKSIEPIFTRNLPTLTSADLEDLQMLINTGVRLSNRTLLELIPNKFINNVEEELERIEEEGVQGFIDFSQDEEVIEDVE